MNSAMNVTTLEHLKQLKCDDLQEKTIWLCIGILFLLPIYHSKQQQCNGTKNNVQM
jgi:hypothetical protein